MKDATTNLSVKQKDSSGSVMDRLMGAIDEADEQAATARVAELRAKYPLVEPEALVGMLIKQKCLQAGAVGSVTSSASVIPGLGVFVSMIFGVAADIGMTAKMQAELVLEIAAAYQQQLSAIEKQSALVMVTGMSAEANDLLEKAGQEIAQKASVRLTKQQAATRAISELGVAASAGSNILSTYVVGRRAKIYFEQGSEAVDKWDDSLRSLLSINQQEIVEWLAETTAYSWQLVRDNAQTATDTVIVAGQSVGELIVVSADKASSSVAKGAGLAAGTVMVAGGGLAAGAGKAATGAKHGVVKGAGLAAGTIVEAGRLAAAGAGKVGRVAKGLLGRTQEEDE